ncbi:hypothetical protein G7054_g13179 [Neopestalotiopsis clavispora]|nr:hypothetical protein G7054_g13179 [Neopestalotiopsis clavispora]
MFTPELLISTPRRGPAVPNSDGSLALFSQSAHAIGGKTTKGYFLLNIESGSTDQLITDESATNAVWLGHDNHTVLFLSREENGITLIMTVDASDRSAAATKIGQIDAPVSDLKVKALKDGSVALIVVGLVGTDGALYNKEQQEPPVHSGRVFDSMFPRTWDSYVEPQQHTLWYTDLRREGGAWELTKPLRNILAGTSLTASLDMYEPGNHAEHFDISDNGILFSATADEIGDPNKPASNHIYYLPFPLPADRIIDAAIKISLQVDADVQSTAGQGWCFSPKFSSDGATIAFMRAAARNSLDPSIWVKFAESKHAVDVFTTITNRTWNLIPDGFKFAPDGHSLYIEALDSGRAALFTIDLLPNAVPTPVVRDGSVSAYHDLPTEDEHGEHQLMVTSSSLVEPWYCQIVRPRETIASPPQILSKISWQANIDLSREQISEIHFPGAGDYKVHSWIVKPRNFDANKKYPLCILVHGGPYAAWIDGWSTRWNPVVWAEQGYVVVTPNITGSQGWGLDMAAGIRNNWGDRPYNDLLKCVEFLKSIPYIDVDNAVAAGNSYGGYMMNWMQGHSLGRRFKALVCHNGIFHIPTFLLESDTLASLGDEWGSSPFMWSNSEGLERYNPARPDLLKNWKTPMLVVHSDRDYRVPVTQGLAAFHTLKALGIPARFLNFPDENHWVSKEENSLEWHRQVFAWINKWTGNTGK